MRQTLVLSLVCMLFAAKLLGQPNYTANSQVPAFTGPFGVGVNMGFYANWTNINQAVIAAGDPSLGIKGVGATTIRPGMSADVYANFGYDISQPDFVKFKQLGMEHFTGIIGGPPEWQRDFTNYCTGNPSTLFKDMYLPIWDNSDGTPINEANHYAYYLYRVVNMYKDDVTFWEIWNEPGFDYTAINGRKVPGEPGNWWDNDPDPCDYKLRAPIQHYVRMLRISWEVIKTLDPDSYVTIGDPGFPSFLDAVLRNTDNPDSGAVTTAFPLKGGAYFDCMTFHSYPHFDFTAYDPFINLFKRHSDGGADGLIVARDRFQNILNNYGYNGTTYPKKLWNVTEYNAPRRAITGPWVNGADMQINYLLKVLMKAKKEQIAQMHIYNLFDVRNDAEAIDEFDLMGMYANNTGVLPYQQLVNPQGKAMHTFTTLLENARYDTAATLSLNLPATVGGYAFKLPNDSLVYALWAKTQTDLSEVASATYSFPASLQMDSLVTHDWEYGYTSVTTIRASDSLQLNGRPLFFKRKVENACALNTIVSNITCNNNGTQAVATDDKWSFSLLVQSPVANTQGWRFVMGTDTISGNYGIPKLVSGMLISNGNLQVTIVDKVNPTCTKPILVTAPAPCSVPPATNYCASQSEFPWHDWIAGFAVGGIQNPSGKNAYTDFTSQSTTLTPGTTYSATLTPGFSWLSFQENWRVWIDFNKNKVFEPSELVLEKAQTPPALGAANTATTANLVIPPDVATGTTRMRVSMRRGTFAEPCDLLSFGEVEDYAVNISGATGSCNITANISGIACNDNGTPTMGSDDTYTFKALVTGTNASAGWSATNGTTAVSGTYGQERTLGPYSILTNTLISFTDQTQTTCATTTEVQKPNPCSNGGGTGTYCNSTSDFPWHDWIAQIKVADLDHVTSKAPYTHYPDKTATVQKGATHIVQLTGGYSWMVEDEFWRIWIDYNKDGTFTDNEIAFSKFNEKSPYPASLWSVNGSMTIPTTVSTGITRMRIVMRRGNVPPLACGNYPNGETEDYSVNVTNSTGGNNCAISAVVNSVACQNKGTATATDDTYSFDLLVTGAGSVSALGWTATYGTTTITGSYGQPKAIANRLISAGNTSIVVQDKTDSLCTQTVLVTPPATCSGSTGPCTATSAHPWHDWIAGIQFANVNQTSSKTQYSDFTNQVAQVRRDSVYEATLTAGYSWVGYPSFWRAWVDSNKDGEWSADEIVLEKSFTSAPNNTYTIEYIANLNFSQIVPGTHKMRIIMRRDTYPEACGVLDYGEIEDYTVQVAQSLNSSQGTYTAPQIAFENEWAIYPNPATDWVVVGAQEPLAQGAQIKVIDGFGRIMESVVVPEKGQFHQFYTTNWATGIYLMSIEVPGQRTVVRKVVVIKE
jgi:GEVED domain/Secretion system C-terminal sorting domain